MMRALGAAAFALTALYFATAGLMIAGFLPTLWRDYGGLMLPAVLIPYAALLVWWYVRANASRWYVERGEPEKALEVAHPAALRPGMLRSRREAAGHAAARARALLLLDRPEKAREALEAAPQVRGRAADDLALAHAELAMHRGDPETALANLEGVESARAWALRGELAADSGDLDTAREALERAEWQDAKDARVRRLRARLDASSAAG